MRLLSCTFQRIGRAIGLKANAATRGTGLGVRLVETFTRQLRAQHAVSPANHGTRHLIRIPPAA
jgi:two-component sensor histidine kinase